MADVFISYARNDYDRADRLRRQLEATGLTVFLDVDGLDGGDTFPDVLDREIKTAGAVIGLWTPHALTRPWVKIECLIGKDRNVLIPVMAEPIGQLDIPAAFYSMQMVDLTDPEWSPDSQGFRNVLRSLSRTLNRPDLKPLPLQTPLQPNAEKIREDTSEVTGENNEAISKHSDFNRKSEEALQASKDGFSEVGLKPLYIALIVLGSIASLVSWNLEVESSYIEFSLSTLLLSLAFIVGQFSPHGSLRLRITLTMVAGLGLLTLYLTQWVALGGMGWDVAAISVCLLFPAFTARTFKPKSRWMIWFGCAMVMICVGIVLSPRLALFDKLTLGGSSSTLLVLAICLSVYVSRLKVFQTLMLILAIFLASNVASGVVHDGNVFGAGIKINGSSMVYWGLLVVITHFVFKAREKETQRAVLLSWTIVGWVVLFASPFASDLLDPIGRLFAEIISPVAHAQSGTDQIVVTGTRRVFVPTAPLFFLLSVLTGIVAGRRSFLVAILLGAVWFCIEGMAGSSYPLGGYLGAIAAAALASRPHRRVKPDQMNRPVPL